MRAEDRQWLQSAAAPDFLYSLIKAMFMATAAVLVACYYGYNASGGPVGMGRATAKSMVLNIVLVHAIGDARNPGLLGGEPARADRRLAVVPSEIPSPLRALARTDAGV